MAHGSQSSDRTGQVIRTIILINRDGVMVGEIIIIITYYSFSPLVWLIS